jgi:hypothetical protein
MLCLGIDGSQREKAQDKDDGDWGHFHESPRSYGPDKISSQSICAASPSQAHFPQSRMPLHSKVCSGVMRAEMIPF